MEQVILVVDDDTANLALAQKILGKEYRIAAANSGMVAFKYLENKCPDLILLDINMPEMDGFEVMNKISAREEWSNIPIVFLTADSESETESRCLEAGAMDFIAKPFVPVVMCSRIARILELEELRKSLANRLDQKMREVFRNVLLDATRISY